jgi:GT2 family glycosyltransferase
MTDDEKERRPVCVVVVNWNGWRDTLVCVDSVLRSDYPSLWIVLCDSGSTDDSWEHLCAGLNERLPFPPTALEQACGAAKALAFDAISSEGTHRQLHLLQIPRNLGYAAALNTGIEWGQLHFSATSFWLLNNDVKVEPQALARLVEAKDAVPGAGICGSVLLDWEQPTRIQAIGGVFRKVLGVGWHLQRLPYSASPPNVCLDIDYPVGASLFVEADYLQQVGLLDDSYFLYYEEMDWVQRGRRHGFRPLVALESRVLHKEGASTGSHGGVRKKSLLSERYGVINRLRITRKFWPAYLPLVWLSLWLVVLDRLMHSEWSRARLVLSLMFAPRSWLH